MSLPVALDYRRAGLCVLPARLDPKMPTLPTWKEYQKRLPGEEELRQWFSTDRPMCLITGAVSGNLEMIDFDCAGELFPAWLDLVRSEAPALVERLVIERSVSGGRHVVYRCAGPVSKNTKLAQREVEVPSDQAVVYCGKSYVPRRKGERWVITPVLIETRGQGGLFVCQPTPGYTPEQGALTDLPVISEAERELLLEAAWSLNELVPEPQPEPVAASGAACGRPGDDFNERGDVRAVLEKHGWQCVRGGDNEYWRRPGKDHGWSATLKNGVFYVFSSNAVPFEPEKAYSRFAVYAWLEHGGDFSVAAAALRKAGLGQSDAADRGVDLSHLVSARPAVEEEPPPREDIVDPGPTPERLLRVPGFINAVMDYTLQTAPYPEPALAFAGALSLQAVLAGRKVRDPADNRTAVYILALANSGAGKDQPRKVNQQVLLAAGLPQAIGDKFASGEGIEDRLFLHPTVLFQTDEIDGVITAINRARDARHESIVNVLLKMYSSANAMYPMRVRAGVEPGIIDQPCLCLFGTAIPQHYYESLSSKMLTSGFLARQLIVESGRRAKGRDVVVQPLPELVVATARWWAEFQPGEKQGNLEHWHPVPRVVELTADAQDYLRRFRERADDEYSKAEERNDAVGMAIWARANEKARRLALVYACSGNHREPVIGPEAARWAAEFVDHQTRRMLFMAAAHVSEDEFDSRCKKLLAILRQWRKRHGERWMPFWQINRKLPCSDRDHEEVRTTLLNQRAIHYDEKRTGGPPQRLYRLATHCAAATDCAGNEAGDGTERAG